MLRCSRVQMQNQFISFQKQFLTFVELTTIRWKNGTNCCCWWWSCCFLRHSFQLKKILNNFQRIGMDLVWKNLCNRRLYAASEGVRTTTQNLRITHITLLKKISRWIEDKISVRLQTNHQFSQRKIEVKKWSFTLNRKCFKIEVSVELEKRDNCQLEKLCLKAPANWVKPCENTSLGYFNTSKKIFEISLKKYEINFLSLTMRPLT